MSLVIVAIPREDDPIWKISSEKVPHMTILFLGDGDNPNRRHIAQFLAHAVTTSLTRFSLDVDRRGEIGEDKADVLFFKDLWDMPRVRDFRAQLLQDNTIKTAYDSSDQFPIWIPHLTLGYPKTPAKSFDNRPYYIDFDRLALWEGDYKGMELVLKNYYSEEVNMSDYSEAGEEFLEHYGVLGMKWGVTRGRISGAMSRQEARVAAGNAKRNAPKNVSVESKLRINKYKTKAKGGEKQTPSDDAVESIVSRQKLKKSGMDSLSNQELKDLSTRLNLEIQVSTLSSKRPRSAKDKFVIEAMKEANKDPVKTAEKGAEALEWLRKNK